MPLPEDSPSSDFLQIDDDLGKRIDFSQVGRRISQRSTDDGLEAMLPERQPSDKSFEKEGASSLEYRQPEQPATEVFKRNDSIENVGTSEMGMEMPPKPEGSRTTPGIDIVHSESMQRKSATNTEMTTNIGMEMKPQEAVATFESIEQPQTSRTGFPDAAVNEVTSPMKIEVSVISTHSTQVDAVPKSDEVKTSKFMNSTTETEELEDQPTTENIGLQTEKLESPVAPRESLKPLNEHTQSIEQQKALLVENHSAKSLRQPTPKQSGNDVTLEKKSRTVSEIAPATAESTPLKEQEVETVSATAEAKPQKPAKVVPLTVEATSPQKSAEVVPAAVEAKLMEAVEVVPATIEVISQKSAEVVPATVEAKPQKAVEVVPATIEVIPQKSVEVVSATVEAKPQKAAEVVPATTIVKTKPQKAAEVASAKSSQLKRKDSKEVGMDFIVPMPDHLKKSRSNLKVNAEPPTKKTSVANNLAARISRSRSSLQSSHSQNKSKTTAEAPKPQKVEPKKPSKEHTELKPKVSSPTNKPEVKPKPEPPTTTTFASDLEKSLGQLPNVENLRKWMDTFAQKQIEKTVRRYVSKNLFPETESSDGSNQRLNSALGTLPPPSPKVPKIQAKKKQSIVKGKKSKKLKKGKSARVGAREDPHHHRMEESSQGYTAGGPSLGTIEFPSAKQIKLEEQEKKTLSLSETSSESKSGIAEDEKSGFFSTANGGQGQEVHVAPANAEAVKEALIPKKKTSEEQKEAEVGTVQETPTTFIPRSNAIPPNLKAYTTMGLVEYLKKVQDYIDQLGYHREGEPSTVVNVKMSIKHLMGTARTLIRLGLPIKCLHAMILGIHFTNQINLMERFPIHFKSTYKGQEYKHVVLGIYLHGAFGALGISRDEGLQDKAPIFKRLSELANDYFQCYHRSGHQLLEVKIGDIITHDPLSLRQITWKLGKVSFKNPFDPDKAQQEFEKISRRLRSSMGSDCLKANHYDPTGATGVTEKKSWDELQDAPKSGGSRKARSIAGSPGTKTYTKKEMEVEYLKSRARAQSLPRSFMRQRRK